ncbi:MAG: flippase [Alphaproteobacteria bacterium]|nr:flippase [Alphaproteobacteria bacterium]
MSVLKKIKKMGNHEGFLKYFKNTSWLIGERVFRLTLSLFIGVWIARYLGPAQYGVFNYALSFVGLFTAIATLGLDSIVIRELVNNEKKIEHLIATTFWLKLMGAIFVLVLLAIAVNFTSNSPEENTYIFIIASAILFQSFNVVDYYFQSKVISKYVVYANLFSLLLSSTIKICLILTAAPLISFVYVFLFDSIVLSLGLILFFIKNNENLKVRNFRYIKSEAIFLLKESWPLILSGLVISIYMKIDQVMIKEYMDNSAVGQYAAAVRLSEAWYFIPMLICSSLFPALVNARKDNEQQYLQRMQNLYQLMVWLSLAIAIPVTFIAPWVVEILYEAEYAASSGVLIIHIWALLFVSLGVARGKWILLENLQIYSLVYLGVGVVVNIAGNYYLIPTMGINGAAIATLLSQGIGTLLMPVFIKKTRPSFVMMVKSLLLVYSFSNKKNKQTEG